MGRWTQRPPDSAIILPPLEAGAKAEENTLKHDSKAFGINGFLNGR